ncbi:MAG TPA: hypothetical protein QF753_05325 [Victivallales bacterium]|nr:hypothetical protein [Victivallales bacterium]
MHDSYDYKKDIEELMWMLNTMLKFEIINRNTLDDIYDDLFIKTEKLFKRYYEDDYLKINGGKKIYDNFQEYIFESLGNKTFILDLFNKEDVTESEREHMKRDFRNIICYIIEELNEI